VHYNWKRVGKGEGKKGSSGIFRSLPEVHRYLNSLWLLAEEHLGRLDFSCCYGADGVMTDFGRERATAAAKNSKDAAKDNTSLSFAPCLFRKSAAGAALHVLLRLERQSMNLEVDHPILISHWPSLACNLNF